jgi:predicted outer membrane repeat protein
MRHHLAALLATALAACNSGPKDPDDTDIGNTDAADTDAADTDAVDTDAVDTDLLDTDSVDTDLADTDAADTDLGDTDTGPVGPVDLDGDGSLSDVDCDDNNPSVYPGAPNLCDGGDRSCGQFAVDPVGTAALQDALGAWSDVTATLAAGTFDAPTSLDVPADGVLRVCGGTWAARLSAAANATIEGIGAPVFDQGSPYTAVSGYGGGVSIRGIVVKGNDTDASALIEVSQGTARVEDVEVIGRTNAIAVTSAGHLTLVNSSLHDQAGDGVRLFAFGTGASATLEGVEIYDLGGAALVGSTDGTLTATDVTIRDVGKGVQTGGGEVTLTDVTMTRPGQPIDASGPGAGHFLRLQVTGATTVATWYAGDLDITASSFEQGVQGLIVTAGGSVKLTEVTFADLDAGASWGGGLYVTGALGGALVKDCTFERNKAENGGAVLAAMPVEFVGTQFHENSAVFGGAVYLSPDATATTFDGITATSNSAVGAGGAIYSEAGLNLANSTLSFNTSGAVGGGAVFARGAAQGVAVLSANEFSDNTTTGSGGAVFAIYLESTADTFTGNTASGLGGALFVGGASNEVFLVDDSFVSNAAGMVGGAVGWEYGMTVTRCLFDAVGGSNSPTAGGWSAGPFPVALLDGSYVCQNGSCL